VAAILVMSSAGGCGGGDKSPAKSTAPSDTETAADPAKSTAPSDTETAAETVPAGLQPALSRLSSALDELGAVAKRADCHELPQLRAAVRQVRRRAAALDRFAGADPETVEKAQRFSREALRQAPGLIRDCHDQFGLENTAKELKRQADELDQLGEQP
jgi:hypothetical protein